MTTGIIRWINETRRFGLITQDTDGKALFARFQTGSKPLRQRQKVSYDIVVGPDGEYAVNIKSIA
jgi:cold shock CspA family protein